MKSWILTGVLVLPLLAGCLDPDGELTQVVYTAKGPLEDIHETGSIDAERRYTVFQFEVQEAVNGTAVFTPSVDIEYAKISFRACDSGGGTGTGFEKQFPVQFRDRFQPGTGCITVETRHTASFDYTLDVTFTP